MSSILKALKKLEKNAPPASERVDAPAWLNREEKRPGQGGHRLVDPEQVLGPKGRTLGFFGKIVAASVFMGIAVGGMAFWNVVVVEEEKIAAPKPSANSATGKEAAPIPSLPKPAPETAPPPLPKPPVRAALTPPHPQIKPKERAALQEKSRPAAAPKPFIARRSETVSPEKESRQIDPRSELPLRTEPRIALSRLKQVEEPEPSTSADPIADPIADSAPPRTQVEIPSPIKSLAALSPAFAAAEQRSDPRFQIQALVWAEDPIARMAMVNGRIVKIGSSIDGVSIRHIGNDFILFEEGENRWKHPFRVQ